MRHGRRAISFLSIPLLALLGCAKGNDVTGSGGSGPGSSRNRGRGGQSGSGGAGTTGRAGAGGGVDDPFAGLPAAKALHVDGNKLRDASNAEVRLLGINRAGSEYMCSPPTQGGQAFDGSTGPSSINAMLSWNINTVRLPL